MICPVFRPPAETYIFKKPIGMAEFGEQLRKAREEKGMTQQSLAEKVYVTRMF